MSELTHENYPNHIDQEGLPIVGSQWSFDGHTYEILELSKNHTIFEGGDSRCVLPQLNFLHEFTPYRHLVEKTDFEKAVETWGEKYDLLEVYEDNNHWWAYGEWIDEYLTHVNCVGFIYYS